MDHRLLGAALVSVATGIVLPAAAAESSIDPVLASTNGGAALARRNRFLEWHPVQRGRPLPADSELTCSAGCTVRTFDGSTLTLDPGAHVSVAQVTFVPMGGTFAALGRRFELLEGSVAAHVVNDPKRARTLVIGTPNDAFIAVRPGDAQIVAGVGRAGVACLQGGVRVKHGKSTADLKAGEAASLSDTRSALSTHALEGGPRWRAATGKLDDPQPLAVAIGDRLGTPAVAWEPTKGASGYRVELSDDGSFGKIVESARVDASQLRYVAKGLAAGSYFARLIALDSDGLASRPSAPTQLRVVSIIVPVGGYADADHALVVAPEGTTLKLSDNAKLEMAVDDHKFSPASSEWLADGSSHVVRLRLHGDFGRESRLLVEPRALKADIRMGPALARWPEDPVDIAISIQDDSGRYDPGTVAPDIQVLVGVEPVAIDWKHEGAMFTGKLAPRSTSAPEVVRVIVRDQNGALLGRNFLEIEPILEPVHFDKQLAKK